MRAAPVPLGTVLRRGLADAEADVSRLSIERARLYAVALEESDAGLAALGNLIDVTRQLRRARADVITWRRNVEVAEMAGGLAR